LLAVMYASSDFCKIRNKSNILIFVLVGWCATGAIKSTNAAEPLARDVTYTEVLKDSDNVDLNILYAPLNVCFGP